MDKGFVIRAAGLLMVIQVLSRVLGYARDSVLQNFFGRSFVTDAFNAAFSIPDFIYNILIGGAISSCFYPGFFFLPCIRGDQAGLADKFYLFQLGFIADDHSAFAGLYFY